MQKKFIALMIMLAPTLVMAGGLSGYTGKYAVKNCSFDGVTRAYVSFTKTKEGKATELLVQLYGDEATAVSLALVGSTNPNPNYKYGNPIKAVITEVAVTATAVLNQKTYIYGDDHRELAQVESLTKTATGLVYRSQSAKADGGTKEYCVLAR